MNNDRIRLTNPQRFNVGVITIDKPYGINIAPGAFTIVSKDDLDYITATSGLIRDGILRVEGEAQEEVLQSLGIEKEDNANFMSDEEIRKKLSGNANQLRKWLESNEIKPFVLEKIADIAKEMNLSMNKIKVLQDKMPEYDFMK